MISRSRLGPGTRTIARTTVPLLACGHKRGRRKGAGLARSWTISGVGEPTRAAVTAAASEAGMPLGQWVEQALKKALAEGLEPGVSIEEIEARRRQVVADAVQPVQETIARIELATAPSSPDVARRPPAAGAAAAAPGLVRSNRCLRGTLRVG